MLTRRAVTVVATGAALLVGGPAPTYAADPGDPSGTFSVDRTTTFVHYNPNDDSPPYASVGIYRSNLSDDHTDADHLVTEIDPGDGSGLHPWSCTGNSCYISWSRAGTFTPKASLTDGDGHTTMYTLAKVTVLPDHTVPAVKLTQPRPRLRHRKAGWRIIRGHAADSGVGVNFVNVIVSQKRHGRWYYYLPYKHRWHKGLRTEAATNQRFRPPGGEAILLANHAWRTPRVRGLTRGRIVVRVWAEDINANRFGDKVLARGGIRRR